MPDIEDTIERLRPHIEDHFKDSEEFTLGETPIRLSHPTYGAEEVLETLESLLSTHVTMGEKVEKFEQAWTEYVDTTRAHMVNSGSSANLLALRALAGDIIEPGDEVIVPAVAWSTTLFPVLDIGATPVLVDVDLDTYTIDVDAFAQAITEETAAVVLVHLLGHPCDMDPILNLCTEHDIVIVEDCCEAHGAAYRGQRVGSFGDVGTFSFYFSHHISTIEGGMVVTDDETISKRTRMARAHGWVREVDNPEGITDDTSIDKRYLFGSHGYNLRPTDIQGAFGIHQLPRLDQFVERRRENAADLTDRLETYDDYFRFFTEQENAYCSWFAYPFQVRPDAPFTRDQFQSHLEDNNIETRPILAGNLARQPVMDEIDHRIVGNLDAANRIHDEGLFIGNHHKLTEEKRDYIAETVESFVESRT